jgi:hypothetical protein
MTRAAESKHRSSQEVAIFIVFDLRDWAPDCC